MINEKSHEEECVCQSNFGLFIPNRQVSIALAGLIMIFFLVFLTGYLMGKRTAVTQLCQKMEQESFNDQVYASLCALNEENQSSAVCNVSEPAVSVSEKAMDEPIQENEAKSVPNTVPTVQKNWFAPLIGFGKQLNAQQFVQKMHEKEIPVRLKTRTSKTAKGKTIHWYQVVTHSFSDRNELQALVDRIAREENIKDIRIKQAA